MSTVKVNASGLFSFLFVLLMSVAMMSIMGALGYFIGGLVNGWGLSITVGLCALFVFGKGAYAENDWRERVMDFSLVALAGSCLYNFFW